MFIDDLTKKTWKSVIKGMFLKKPKDIFENDKIENIPITGGNLFQTTEYLKSITHKNTLMYLMLIDVLKYKRQEIRFIGDKDIEKIQDSIFTILLLYGSVGIRRNKNNEITLYGLNEIKYDYDIQIKEANCYLANRIGLGIPFNFDKTDKFIKLNKNNCVFATCGEEALSLWIRALPWIKARVKVLDIWGGNVTFLSKKVKVRIRGTDAEQLDLQIESLYNPDSRVILEFDQGVNLDSNPDDENIAKSITKGKLKPKIKTKSNFGELNTFEPMLERDDPNKDAKLDYEFITNIQYDMLDMRYNKESKASRLIAGESAISQAKVELGENDWYWSCKKLADNWNRIYHNNKEVLKVIKTLNQPQDDNNNDKDHTKEGNDVWN